MTEPTSERRGGAAAGRPRATIAAELADVERHLAEAPPHSSGDRNQLEVRRASLQRELAAARRDRGAGGR